MVKNRVKEIRKDLEMSQGQLAVKSGVSVSTISEVENGTHQPSIEVALRLAKALKAPVGDVFQLLE